MHVFASFVSHLESIVSQGGIYLVFIISIVEALPIIGSAIPGHTFIILAGFLAKVGVLNLTAVLVLSSVGAMIGDAIGYFVGKRYGYSFIEKIGKHFFVQKEHIDRARKVIDSHTGKAIIIGRFNPVTRAIVPFLVGASGVHSKRFWMYDIIGCLLWVFVSVGIGYIFGASYHIVLPYLGRSVFAAILIAILIIWGYRFINSRWHIFIKYDLFVLILNLIALYFFFKTMQDAVSAHSFMESIDIYLNEWFSNHVHPIGVMYMVLVTTFFSHRSHSHLLVV